MPISIRHYNMDDSANWRGIGTPVRDVEQMGAEERLYWNKLIKKYLRLNGEMRNRIQTTYEELFGNASERTMGVAVREGYLCALKKRMSHSSLRAQPEMKDLVADTKKYADKWECERVFLMCETEETICEFENEFKGKLIYTHRPRKPIEQVLEETGYASYFHRNDDRVSLTKDYVEEVWLLSKCNCLLSGWTNGTAAAMLIKDGGYEEAFIYDMGKLL